MASIPGMSKQDEIQIASMAMGIVILEVGLTYFPKYSGVLLPVVFVPFVASMFVVGWWTKMKSASAGEATNVWNYPSREPTLHLFHVKPDEPVPIDGKPGKLRYPVRFKDGEEFTHRRYGKKKKIYVDVWGLWEEVVKPDLGWTTYHGIETEHNHVDRVVYYEKRPVVEDGEIIPIYDLVVGTGNVRAIDILVDAVMTKAGRDYDGDVVALLESLTPNQGQQDASKGGEELERQTAQGTTA